MDGSDVAVVFPNKINTFTITSELQSFTHIIRKDWFFSTSWKATHLLSLLFLFFILIFHSSPSRIFPNLSGIRWAQVPTINAHLLLSSANGISLVFLFCHSFLFWFYSKAFFSWSPPSYSVKSEMILLLYRAVLLSDSCDHFGILPIWTSGFQRQL